MTTCPRVIFFTHEPGRKDENLRQGNRIIFIKRDAYMFIYATRIYLELKT